MANTTLCGYVSYGTNVEKMRMILNYILIVK